METHLPVLPSAAVHVFFDDPCTLTDITSDELRDDTSQVPPDRREAYDEAFNNDLIGASMIKLPWV